MRKISLFIAMSLDGYIADNIGKVDWLQGQGDNQENKDSYSAFVKNVDTILMGWNTYHQIVTELSVNEWVYDEFTTYVFTHKKKESTQQIRFTDQDPVDLIKAIKKEEGKDIWICGGANLIRQILKEDVIDIYYITVIPIILGSGLRLFDKSEQEIKLKLLRTDSYNGMVDLVYERRISNYFSE